jgi:peptide-methionine (S)-S-oxide reductase
MMTKNTTGRLTPASTPWALSVAGVPLLVAMAWSLATEDVSAQEQPVAIPTPAMDASSEGGTATAIFAGGCFWGVQGVFQHVEGVTGAVSGYAGGTAETATYDQTSSGTTGHAEAVQVTYDPDVVSYGELLQIFFSVAHNPTQLNYQGPDHGPQYRSALFPMDEVQKRVAEAYIAQLDAAHLFQGPIVTAIEEAEAFYPAEAYHQNYLTLHPDQPYIATHDLPKIEALEELFPDDYRAEPVLVGES